MDMIVEVFREADTHHALGRLNRERRIGGDLGGEGASARHQFGVRDDVIGQTHLKAFLRRERAAGEDDLCGLGPAQHARQKPCPA